MSFKERSIYLRAIRVLKEYIRGLLSLNILDNKSSLLDTLSYSSSILNIVALKNNSSYTILAKAKDILGIRLYFQ